MSGDEGSPDGVMPAPVMMDICSDRSTERRSLGLFRLGQLLEHAPLAAGPRPSQGPLGPDQFDVPAKSFCQNSQVGLVSRDDLVAVISKKHD